MVAFGALYGVLWFVSPGQVGLGDVKLAPSLGLALGWLGFGACVTGLIAIHALGALWAVGLLATRRGGRGTSFAFGPFLLAGTLVAVLVQA